MKAVRLHGRNGPGDLVYENAPLPRCQPGDALIRVYATGITPAELTWGETYRHPDGSERLPAIPGHEVSGVVEALTEDAKGVRVGEAVYGLTDFPRDGAAAEYVAVRAANLAPKPRRLDHCQSAAVPLSALTAWQALFQHGGLTPGQRVLIHGAAGGVGTFAVQFARRRGIHVTATASARNRDFLLKLGANEVIDYTTAPFEEKLSDIDMVLDTVGGEARDRSWGVLRRGGTLVAITAPIVARQPEKFGVRGVFFIVQPSRDQLTEIAGLLDAGTIKPVLGEVLPLARAWEAFERGAAGHNRGKTVLQVRD